MTLCCCVPQGSNLIDLSGWILTCIIDEAIQSRFQFLLRLLYECPHTVFPCDITTLEGHLVNSILLCQLPQCLLAEFLINIRDANLRSWPRVKLANITWRLMTGSNLTGGVSLQKLCPTRPLSPWWRQAWSRALTFWIWNVAIWNMQSSVMSVFSSVWERDYNNNILYRLTDYCTDYHITDFSLAVWYRYHITV